MDDERRNMQALCSTGAFTRSSDPRSHEAIVRYAQEFVADGLEIIFYPRWSEVPERIVRELRSCKLPFPVLHLEKSIGDSFGSSDAREREQGILRFEQNCAFAQQLGVQIAVLHLWEMPSSDLQLEHNLQPLARCLDLAEQYGLALAIEHDHRACVALDTEFLAWHDQLEAVFTASWLWQTPLVRHVHLKDYDGHLISKEGRHYLHLGEGEIDFRRFVRQLRAARFDGALSLESRAIDHEGQVQVARIQTSLQFMRHLAASGEPQNAGLGDLC